MYFAAIFKIIFLSPRTYYLGLMSCLISFERRKSSFEEHETIENYQKILSNVRIRTPNKARPRGYQSTVFTTRLKLDWYEWSS